MMPIPSGKKVQIVTAWAWDTEDIAKEIKKEINRRFYHGYHVHDIQYQMCYDSSFNRANRKETALIIFVED